MYMKKNLKELKVLNSQKIKNSIHARHLFTIWVDPKSRDDCMHKIQQSNIGVAVNFRAIHLLDYFKKLLILSLACFQMQS